MTVARQKARAFGLALEWRAAIWLAVKGYRILARNYRVKDGEIDIVALSPGRWAGRAEVCFVEVRGRSDVATAQGSVDPAKQARVRKAANAFLARHSGFRSLPRRFDIVAAGRLGGLTHSRAAFDA